MAISNEKIQEIIKKQREQNPNKRYRKIFEKGLSGFTHVMKCPNCDSIQASASERMYLPDFSSCGNIKCDY